MLVPQHGFSEHLVKVLLDRAMPGTSREEVMVERDQLVSRLPGPRFWGCALDVNRSVVTFEYPGTRSLSCLTVDKNQELPELARLMISRAVVPKERPDTAGLGKISMLNLLVDRILTRLPTEWELAYETIDLWYEATLAKEQERERESTPQFTITRPGIISNNGAVIGTAAVNIQLGQSGTISFG